jgi:nucleoside-diphosphate-sugar epimerase
MPGAPRIGFSFVDVRDVAKLHVDAMLSPAAGGERFIAVAEFLWMAEVAAVLRRELGEDARKVPTRKVPDLLVKAMGLFDPSVRTITNQLGKKLAYSNEKARTQLGWTTRPLEQTIAETGRRMVDLGVV